MSLHHPDPLALERVPDVAVVVIVARKEDPARQGKGNRGDTAKNIVVCVVVQFAVCSEVEQLARRVVGTGRESVPIREEPGLFSDASLKDN
jgi:hypothetical protein